MKGPISSHFVAIIVFSLLSVGCQKSGPGSDGTPIVGPPTKSSPKTSSDSEDEVPPEETQEENEEVVVTEEIKTQQVDCTSTSSEATNCMATEVDEVILSSDIVSEYSDNVCFEGQTWNINSSSTDVVTSSGCSAIFEIKTASKNAYDVLTSTKVPGDALMVKSIDLSGIGLETILKGDIIDMTESTNLLENNILIPLDQNTFSSKVTLLNIGKESISFVLNERGEILKVTRMCTIVDCSTSSTFVVHGIYESAYLLIANPLGLPDLKRITEHRILNK